MAWNLQIMSGPSQIPKNWRFSDIGRLLCIALPGRCVHLLRFLSVLLCSVSNMVSFLESLNDKDNNPPSPVPPVCTEVW